ncbi:DUF2805 domain-containing protein [Flavobacterium araucananum]|uniref:Uncharacterized protein n=1 Tax=Flavobacterium araucananum TaxID=946678 RepID=A0A227P6M9_9FLAO|nr:hypothetical protein B0A64_13610 [Flavobacterium araucananum]
MKWTGKTKTTFDVIKYQFNLSEAALRTLMKKN